MMSGIERLSTYTFAKVCDFLPPVYLMLCMQLVSKRFQREILSKFSNSLTIEDVKHKMKFSDLQTVSQVADSPNLISWLYRTYGGRLSTAVLINAASMSGGLETLEWLFHHPTLSCVARHCGDAYMHAARHGRIEVLEFLHLRGCDKRESRMTCVVAANEGYFDALKWAVEHGFECSDSVSDILALKGEFEVLRWVLEHGGKVNFVNALRMAAHGCHIDVMRYLLQRRTQTFEGRGPQSRELSTIYLAAAQSGQLEVLEFLLKEEIEVHPRTCVSAAGGGGLKCLRWAHHQLGRESLSDEVVHTAAISRNVQILQYLWEQGCAIPELVCVAAAMDDDLDFIKYAVENWGCSLSPQICEAAVDNDNLELLEYVLANGCTPCEDRFPLAMAVSGNVRFLRYALRNGIQLTPKALERASFWGNLKFLQVSLQNEMLSEDDEDRRWNPHRCLKIALDERQTHVADWICEHESIRKRHRIS